MNCAPQTPEERARVQRAMSALDTMATTWAMTFKLREGVAAMMKLPDGEDRLVAFVKQAYCEGLYDGRMSHIREKPPTGGTRIYEDGMPS